MPTEVNIPALDMLMGLGEPGTRIVQQVAGDAVLNQLRDYLEMLDVTRPNKLAGERTHLMQGLADRMILDVTDEAAEITIGFPFRQRLYGGDIFPVNASLLTIPARSESYNHRARDFTDLHFVQFRSGAKALAQDKTGLVYFWLCESVHQEPDPTMLPTDDEIYDTAVNAVGWWWMSRLERESGF